MNPRSLVFAFVFCLFLCGPILLWGAQHMPSVVIPSWLSAEDASYLAGGTAETRFLDHVSLDSFLAGDLQREADDVVGNSIPAKASAILGTAALQRCGIEASNLLLGFECYPTYYGSSYAYFPGYSSIRSLPSNNPEWVKEGMLEFGDKLIGFADAHPDIDVCLVLPSTPFSSTDYPMAIYTPQSWDNDIAANDWMEQFSEVDNLHVAYDPMETFEDYLAHYYRCDDHWCGYGALDAYNVAAERLGMSPIGASAPSVDTLDAYSFVGQAGRSARMLLVEPGLLREPELDVSNLSVGEELAETGLMMQEGIPPAEPKYALYSFYAWYYGGDYDASIINENAQNDERVLVICDSYGDAFRWMVAQNARETHAFYDLHSSNYDEATFSQRIEESEANKVIFVGYPGDYATFLERHPGYFE